MGHFCDCVGGLCGISQMDELKHVLIESKSEFNEPWKCEIDDCLDLQIRDCKNGIVVELINESYLDSDVKAFHRIVACVNACRNIDMEMLVKIAKTLDSD